MKTKFSEQKKKNMYNKAQLGTKTQRKFDVRTDGFASWSWYSRTWSFEGFFLFVSVYLHSQYFKVHSFGAFEFGSKKKLTHLFEKFVFERIFAWYVRIRLMLFFNAVSTNFNLFQEQTLLYHFRKMTGFFSFTNHDTFSSDIMMGFFSFIQTRKFCLLRSGNWMKLIFLFAEIRKVLLCSSVPDTMADKVFVFSLLSHSSDAWYQKEN